MPNLTGLAALFRLRPDRAADYLAAKGVKLSGPYWEMDGPQHSHLFTVANLAKMDILQDIRGAVQKALDEGKTEKWFDKQLVDVLKAKGWWGGKDGSLRRLQTIYRTNLQTAYMTGRHQQAMEQKDRRPWAQYLAVRDHRSRPAHAALHGKIFRIDSPAWAAISPPNGYNCRCRARYLSDEDLKKRGLKPAEDIQILEREPPGKMPVNPMTGDTPQRWIQRGVSVPSKTKPGERDILWADPGWDNIPGSDGAERMLVDRLMAKATDLGDGVRMAVQKAIKEVAQQVEKAAPTWTMLKAEQAQLDEIKRLGGERLQELLDLVTPDDRQMFPAMGDRGIRVEELISRGGITNPFINWLRAEMMTRLKGVRPVGGKAFNLVNKSGKAVELSNRVASKLPDTWVEKVNAAGNPYKVTVAENSRGCHWGGLRQIRTNSGSTAEHEWAHAVQSADPILDKLFKDEHQRRTVNEALEWLGGNYKKDELTRKDGYINAYQGKEYQEGGALEVITMAMQTILGEDYSANNMLAAMLKRDREMLRLTLGVLFHYLP